GAGREGDLADGVPVGEEEVSGPVADDGAGGADAGGGAGPVQEPRPAQAAGEEAERRQRGPAQGDLGACARGAAHVEASGPRSTARLGGEGHRDVTARPGGQRGPTPVGGE